MIFFNLVSLPRQQNKITISSLNLIKNVFSRLEILKFLKGRLFNVNFNA